MREEDRSRFERFQGQNINNGRQKKILNAFIFYMTSSRDHRMLQPIALHQQWEWYIYHVSFVTWNPKSSTRSSILNGILDFFVEPTCPYPKHYLYRRNEIRVRHTQVRCLLAAACIDSESIVKIMRNWPVLRWYVQYEVGNFLSNFSNFVQNF